MKKISSFKRVVQFSMLPLLFFALALFASPAYASTSMKENKVNNSIVGTWHMASYFLSGSHKGQTVNVDITFTSDGALTCLAMSGNAIITGKGTWRQIAHSLVTYTNTETIDIGGQTIGIVHATAYLVLTNQGESFIGWASNIINTPDGALLEKNTASLTAQRATA